MKEKNFKNIIVDDTIYETSLTPTFLRRKPYIPYDSRKVNAIIPGVVQEIFVEKGQKVQRNQNLLILEAMKMRNSITSPREGVIKSIKVKQGTRVAKGELLIEFE